MGGGQREGDKREVGGKTGREGAETILKGQHGPMIMNDGINPLTLVPCSFLI